jgi:hypothetical protein
MDCSRDPIEAGGAQFGGAGSFESGSLSKMRARISVVVVAIWLLVVACQSGKVAQTVEPTLPKGADAMGETSCANADARITPLIVDWPQEQRGDAEAEMSGALAVVAYDCKAIRVLPDCHIEGSYGYVS